LEWKARTLCVGVSVRWRFGRPPAVAEIKSRENFRIVLVKIPMAATASVRRRPASGAVFGPIGAVWGASPAYSQAASSIMRYRGAIAFFPKIEAKPSQRRQSLQSYFQRAEYIRKRTGVSPVLKPIAPPRCRNTRRRSAGGHPASRSLGAWIAARQVRHSMDILNPEHDGPKH
jgi:hypothetical protein